MNFADLFNMDLFKVIAMSCNHEERCVANTQEEDFVLDTVLVIDREWTYETAVKHKDFRGGMWIVLEGCATKEEAEAMHRKWLITLRNGVDELRDIFENIVFYKEEMKDGKDNKRVLDLS